MYRRVKRFVLLNIVHVDDTPTRIAAGAALGMFIALTPTFGIQVPLVIALAWACRVNKFAGFAMVWVTNAFTIGPIYTLQYYLGAYLLGERLKLDFISFRTEPGESIGHPIVAMWDSIVRFWISVYDILLPLSVGSLISATVWGVLTYVVVRMAVTQHRLRRAGVDVKGISAHSTHDLGRDNDAAPGAAGHPHPSESDHGNRASPGEDQFAGSADEPQRAVS